MKRIEIPKGELKKLYEEQKLTSPEIAKIYNCCKRTVLKRLHEYNIELRLPCPLRSSLSKRELENLYIKKKLSTWEIEKQHGYPRSTVYKKLLQYGIEPRSRAQSHIIYPRKDFNEDKIDKSYLIGFAMGDLRVRKEFPGSETIKVDCGSTKKEQIELIAGLFKPYGRAWISKPNKRGAVQIECHLNLSFDFLLKERKRIDSWILRQRECFAAFLAAFTDAEGCISISRKGMAYYALGNYNKDILNQIRNRLAQERIRCPKLSESKIKGRLCFGKYFHNQNYWNLRVHRKKSLMDLFVLIGPHLKHAQKLEDMERAKENIRMRNKKYGNINMEP